MKTSTLISSIFLLAICLASPFTSTATNYTNNGTTQSYALSNRDTLRIASGTYTGNLTSFTHGAVVIVSAGTTFKPNYINTPMGKILNYGTSEFGSLGTYSNFSFENFNLLTISGSLSLYDGSRQTWKNNVTAQMLISGSFSMNNALFINYSFISVGGSFSMYTATSDFINRGLLSVTGDLSISNGILTNENRIQVNDLNAWGGQVINEGEISPSGNMTFSNGTTYTNECLLITNAGFTNYGTFQNNGLLWVGRSGTAADHFYNSGTFTNSSDAVVKTVRLTNYNRLAGGGSYYINGASYSSGTVGRNGSTTDSIKIYDLTRTNSNSIFDVQYGTVHSNVVFRPFNLPDTSDVNYTGCSSYYRTDLGITLPVEWNYFTVKSEQGQPLLNWSAKHEASMKFEVERSYNNSSFNSIATIISNNTGKYVYADAGAEKSIVIYYRIKATSQNGTVKYTETKMVKGSAATAASVSVYPNPAKDAVTLTYKADKNEQVTIRIRNAGGQQVAIRYVMTVAGINVISLPEIAALKTGMYVVEVLDANRLIASERIIKQ